MSLYLLKKTDDLRLKQKKILYLTSKTSNKNINLKVHNELSPLGWHIIHCIFVEVIWIRSKLLNDNYYENKLKKIADSTKVPLYKRNVGLPQPRELISFAKKIFIKNILLLKEAIKKKNKQSYIKELTYLINFLNNHHAQHIEIIKNILNLLNIKFNKNIYKIDFAIDPIIYKFKGLTIKRGNYIIGAGKYNFFYDNEVPQHQVFLKEFKISNNVITIPEWLGFINNGGYKKKKFWSQEGWDWKVKNNIFFPLNWVLINKNKFAVSTYRGYKSPLKNMPVSNISKFELEAFANYGECRIPHEYEWEASFHKIKNKYKVWEWSSNQFFGYEGFKSFPYREYSMPWFKNNYYTLKGGSTYTLKDLKRISFRNFYKPSTRYILSGGRLCV